MILKGGKKKKKIFHLGLSDDVFSRKKFHLRVSDGS
jgi:hypothetical protein